MTDKTSDEVVILPESDQAAEFRTDVTGWVSRHGRFFGNSEDTARYDGCTHRHCKGCGGPVRKSSWVCCDDCRRKARANRFAALESVVWDGETPLCIFEGDDFFFDRNELDDYCYEHDCRPSDLELVLCVPVYAQPIDPDDFYEGSLPEDQALGDVCPYLQEQFDELNRYIVTRKPLLSWMPGKTAAIVED